VGLIRVNKSEVVLGIFGARNHLLNSQQFVLFVFSESEVGQLTVLYVLSQVTHEKDLVFDKLWNVLRKVNAIQPFGDSHFRNFFLGFEDVSSLFTALCR